MTLSYSSQFLKQYRKLPKKLKARVGERLELLVGNEFDPLLNNHKLQGEDASYRSINVTGDVRIVYRKTSRDAYLLVAIGTHSELYS